MPLGDAICYGTDTGDYLIMEGDFILGNKGRQEGDERYITLCRAHGADYLMWSEQMNCMWEGCLKKGVLWEGESHPQRWCPTHIQCHLFQGGTSPPTEPSTMNSMGDVSATETINDQPVTPPQSERETNCDQAWMAAFEEYRRENEQRRAAFAVDIQRTIAASLNHGVGHRPRERRTGAKRVDSGSEAEKRRAIADDQAGYQPSLNDVRTSKDGKSSGSASWGDLEKAWNLDPEVGDEEKI